VAISQGEAELRVRRSYKSGRGIASVGKAWL
jgi:hypothetical protein